MFTSYFQIWRLVNVDVHVLYSLCSINQCIILILNIFCKNKFYFLIPMLYDFILIFIVPNPYRITKKIINSK